MVTHEMDVIESVCDYVAVMEQGKVIEHGSTFEDFQSAKTQHHQELYSNCITTTATS